MPQDALVRVRAAAAADEAFVIEIARHACVIEDWPLPDPDDDDVLSMLPSAGKIPIIAEDSTGEPVGAVWTWHNDPPLRVDAAGESVPELCIGVAPGRRGAGIGGVLLDALFARCARTMDVMCANVHVRNPAQHQRKGFEMDGPRSARSPSVSSDQRTETSWVAPQTPVNSRARGGRRSPSSASIDRVCPGNRSHPSPARGAAPAECRPTAR